MADNKITFRVTHTVPNLSDSERDILKQKIADELKKVFIRKCS